MSKGKNPSTPKYTPTYWMAFIQDVKESLPRGKELTREDYSTMMKAYLSRTIIKATVKMIKDKEKK